MSRRLGKVINVQRNVYNVESNASQFACTVAGKLRKNSEYVLVGDNVEFDESNVINKILKRKNELIRPRVSNVDKAFVITSLKQPDLDLNLLDKLLCILEFNNITPVICFTKYDLLLNDDLKEFSNINNYYNKIGYKTYINSEVSNIESECNNSTIVFTGQSGSGKSTLINKLLPDLDLKTNEISLSLNRGKHTTRSVTLYPFNNNSFIIDTPGFSALDLNEMEPIDIRDNFAEIFDYSQDCKYTGCMHTNDTGCNVIKMVNNGEILQSRYDNYLKFIKK